MNVLPSQAAKKQEWRVNSLLALKWEKMITAQLRNRRGEWSPIASATERLQCGGITNDYGKKEIMCFIPDHTENGKNKQACIAAN